MKYLYTHSHSYSILSGLLCEWARGILVGRESPQAERQRQVLGWKLAYQCTEGLGLGRWVRHRQHLPQLCLFALCPLCADILPGKKTSVPWAPASTSSSSQETFPVSFIEGRVSHPPLPRGIVSIAPALLPCCGDISGQVLLSHSQFSPLPATLELWLLRLTS